MMLFVAWTGPPDVGAMMVEELDMEERDVVEEEVKVVEGADIWEDLDEWLIV